jgi:4a-hydroxytetrahydrobiopterin dehydratase
MLTYAGAESRAALGGTMTDRQAVRLDDDEIRTRLDDVLGWKLADGKLQREIVFADFVAAFGFMTKVALHAERLEHHPDWSNVYNRVTIGLNTHDVRGISERDFDLAVCINRLLSE